MNLRYVIEDVVNRCTMLFIGAICGLLLGMAIVSPASEPVVTIEYEIVTVHGMPCLMHNGAITTCDWSNWIQAEPTPKALLVQERPTPDPSPAP